MRRLVSLLVLLATPVLAKEPAQQTPLVRDIGARRELFVNRYCMETRLPLLLCCACFLRSRMWMTRAELLPGQSHSSS